MSLENFESNSMYDLHTSKNKKFEKKDELTEIETKVILLSNQIQELSEKNVIDNLGPNENLYTSLKSLYSKNKEILENADSIYRTKVNILYYQMLHLAKTGSLNGAVELVDCTTDPISKKNYEIKNLNNNYQDIEYLRKSYIEKQTHIDIVSEKISTKKIKIDKESSFQLFPNPFVDNLSISLKGINISSEWDVITPDNNGKAGFGRNRSDFENIYIKNTEDTVTILNGNGTYNFVRKETGKSLLQYITQEEKNKVINSDSYKQELNKQISQYYQNGFSSVTILDSYGRTVKEETINVKINEVNGNFDIGEIQISGLNSLSTGTYHIILKANKPELGYIGLGTVIKQ